MLTAPRRGPIALAYRVLVLPGVIAYLFAASIVVLAADRFWLVDLLTFAWPYMVAAGALLAVAALLARRLKAIVIAFLGLVVALLPAFDVPTARPSAAAAIISNSSAARSRTSMCGYSLKMTMAVAAATSASVRWQCRSSSTPIGASGPTMARMRCTRSVSHDTVASATIAP